MRSVLLTSVLFPALLLAPLALQAEEYDAECGIQNKRTGTGNSFLIQNPETPYQHQMNRLLRMEIRDLLETVAEVEKKRMQLVRIRDRKEPFHTVELDNETGVIRNGRKSNYQSQIYFVFNQGRLHCLRLESVVRPIYEPDKWTRKMIRVRFPGIESLELASERRNMNLLQEMENVNPKHQLKLLRMVINNIKTALYSMDMEIAGFYESRNKKNEWQLDL